MSSITKRYLALCLAASLGLSACMQGGTDNGTRETAASRSQATERDVEDPGTFSRRENALWDGRPSFGGVWVAHPEARAPQRVIIRNTENGRETVGSLFTRERMNPGPAFQVSGEAASAVGILAGAPTMIEVVALRVEEAAPEPQPEAQDATAEAAAEAPPPAESAQDAPEPARAEPRPTEDDEALIAMPQPEAAAPRQGLLGRLFGRGRTQAADPDQIESAPLDATAMAEAPPAAARPAPPESAAPASALAQPYIQLGIFSVESNAANAERMARGADLPVRVVPGSAQGNAFWRVVVGPAQDAGAHAQMLARVKSLGFNDAYAVRR